MKSVALSQLLSIDSKKREGRSYVIYWFQFNSYIYRTSFLLISKTHAHFLQCIYLTQEYSWVLEKITKSSLEVFIFQVPKFGTGPYHVHNNRNVDLSSNKRFGECFEYEDRRPIRWQLVRGRLKTKTVAFRWHLLHFVTSIFRALHFGPQNNRTSLTPVCSN